MFLCPKHSCINLSRIYSAYTHLDAWLHLLAKQVKIPFIFHDEETDYKRRKAMNTKHKKLAKYIVYMKLIKSLGKKNGMYKRD